MRVAGPMRPLPPVAQLSGLSMRIELTHGVRKMLCLGSWVRATAEKAPEGGESVERALQGLRLISCR